MANRRRKSQDKQTLCHQVNLAAIKPLATNPGNAAGNANGQISQMTVPVNKAIIPASTMLLTISEEIFVLFLNLAGGLSIRAPTVRCSF